MKSALNTSWWILSIHKFVKSLSCTDKLVFRATKAEELYQNKQDDLWQAVSSIPFKGWAFTSHIWLLGKACHFILSLCKNNYLHTHSWQCCIREQDMKHSYILKGRALQSILLHPSRRTRHREDLPELSSKAGTGSPINYNSLSPKWLLTLLGPGR